MIINTITPFPQPSLNIMKPRNNEDKYFATVNFNSSLSTYYIEEAPGWLKQHQRHS